MNLPGLNRSINSLMLSNIYCSSPLLISTGSKSTNFLSISQSKFNKFFSHIYYESVGNQNVQFIDSIFMKFKTQVIKIIHYGSETQENMKYRGRSAAFKAAKTHKCFLKCFFNQCQIIASSNNFEKDAGVAFYVEDKLDTSQYTFTGCTFSHCSAPKCGTFYMNSQNLQFISCCISECVSFDSCSAFYVESEVISIPMYNLNYLQICECESYNHLTAMVRLTETRNKINIQNSNISNNKVETGMCFSGMEVSKVYGTKTVFKRNNFQNNQGLNTLGVIDWKDDAIISECNFIERFAEESSIYANLDINSNVIVSNCVFIVDVERAVAAYAAGYDSQLLLKQCYIDKKGQGANVDGNVIVVDPIESRFPHDIEEAPYYCHAGFTNTFTPSNQFSPSNSFSPSNHFLPTISFYPTNVFTPSNYLSKKKPEASPSKKYGISNTQSKMEYTSFFETLSISLTLIRQGDEMVYSEVQVWSYGYIIAETMVNRDITVNLGEANVDKVEYSAGLIIGLSTGGIIVIFILSVVGLYIFRQTRNNSDLDISSNTEESDGMFYEDDSEDNRCLAARETSDFDNLGKVILSINEIQGEEASLDDDWLGA